MKELIAQLHSNTCECGRPKGDMKTFCYACYNALPPALQKNLYRRIGEGYREAVEAARAFIKDRASVRQTARKSAR